MREFDNRIYVRIDPARQGRFYQLFPKKKFYGLLSEICRGAIEAKIKEGEEALTKNGPRKIQPALRQFLQAHLNGKDLPRLSDDELGELITKIQEAQLVTRKERATAGMKRTKKPAKPVDIGALMEKLREAKISE